ncbi:Stress response protein nst1 [Entomortierella beljakovae]|nr:Stress response protein nst1 [Entomortierella beljakovae]
MAAHTFAPEDALPPPKSAVIYSRDGRKRSLNIDMTKHFAPSHHDPSVVPPIPSNHASISATTVSTSRDADLIASNTSGGTSNSQVGAMTSTSSPHKKKKKKKSKKKIMGRNEEGDIRANSGKSHGHSHHPGCQHDHGIHHHSSNLHHHHHEDDEEDDEDFFSDDDLYDPETPAFTSPAAAGNSAQGNTGPTINSVISNLIHGDSSSSRKKKKKRKKSSTTGLMPPNSIDGGQNHHYSHNHGSNSSSSKAVVQSGHRNGHDRSPTGKHPHDGHLQNDGFWHYSDAEERQRIREFWFQLREEERRSLVRVEKEAVLKKMKEQQRHSCSCSLCGRKRTAIEEELELLYDAYYDELEQYANQQQPSDGHALTYSQHSPPFEDDDLSDESRGSDEEDDDDEDDVDDEEGYEDEDEDEDYEDDTNGRKEPFPYRSSNFPNTLQAKGNILTVAEDLLENDGKKFLEMMDRLADRKVQRDDELMDSRGVYEEYDDEEDGDYEDDGTEEDALTKEQRMEEGRRMFQAFAARMFEQRVLSAYREKVAQERQERLLAELEEESRQEQLREERKEREKEKKRDKKRLQRQQKEEERAAKEAQRLAEERRQLEERERKLEADRKRREEERRAKEEEKRQRDEERLKKEEDRKRKQKEEKAREAEKERKRKEEIQAKEQLAREQANEYLLKEQLVKEQLAKEQLATEHFVNEQLAKEQAERVKITEVEVRKAREAAEENSRLEREAYLKQQLAEEQKRQEELRRQEQEAKEELARQEQEQEALTVASIAVTVSGGSDSPLSPDQEHSASLTSSSSSNVVSAPDAPNSFQGIQGRSPITPISTSPIRVPEAMSSQPLPTQGPTTPHTNNLWSNPYPAQPIQQPQIQQMFAQSIQQNLFRPPSHYGHIGSDLDAFSSRMGHNAGRGGYMGTSHQNQTSFQTPPQHQQPSNQLPQPIGGLRSPGLAPVGYGQSNVPSKQVLISSSGSSGNHDASNNSGSPLHSPSTLGAIGTPIGSFGPISPIGHTRRTSTPYGSTSDAIKPIQRPVPIGRPKDSQAHPHPGAIASSFDGISLALSGLTIGSDRSRSPPLNLTGGSSIDLDGVSLGTEPMRSSNSSSEIQGHNYTGENGSMQPLSPGTRNQRESSFYSNSFFSNRMNGHDPFAQPSDFTSYGQQQQNQGALSNASHYMSPYGMHLSSSSLSQQQQQHLYMQQQSYMHPNIQDLQQLQQLQQQQQQQQQLGLSSPPLNGSNTWGRTGYMRPHLNSLVPNGTPNLGLASSRPLSPPPVMGGLQHGAHSPLLPIGSSNGANHLHQHQLQFSHFSGNGGTGGAISNGNGGVGLSVGSGRKSVSHVPPMRLGSVDGSIGNLSNGSDNDRLSNGYHPGFATHHLQQQQQQQPQQHQPHHLGAIGEAGGSRDAAYSL